MSRLEITRRILHALDFAEEWVIFGLRMTEGSPTTLWQQARAVVRSWECNVVPLIAGGAPITPEETRALEALPAELTALMTEWDKVLLVALSRQYHLTPEDLIFQAIERRMDLFEDQLEEQAKADNTDVPDPKSISILDATLAFQRAHADGSSPLQWSAAEKRFADRAFMRFGHVVICDTPVWAITPVVLRAYLGGPGVTPESADQHITLFTSFFDWCLERRYIRESPVPGACARYGGAHHPTIGHRAWVAAGQPQLERRPDGSIVNVDKQRAAEAAKRTAVEEEHEACMMAVHGPAWKSKLCSTIVEEFLTTEPVVPACWFHHLRQAAHRWGDVVLSDVTPEMVRDYFDRHYLRSNVRWHAEHQIPLSKDEASKYPYTREADKAFAMFGAFFQWAVREQRCAVSPMGLIETRMREYGGPRPVKAKAGR